MQIYLNDPVHWFILLVISCTDILENDIPCFLSTVIVDYYKSLYFRVFFISRFCDIKLIRGNLNAFLSKHHIFKYFARMLNSRDIKFANISEKQVFVNKSESTLFAIIRVQPNFCSWVLVALTSMFTHYLSRSKFILISNRIFKTICCLWLTQSFSYYCDLALLVFENLQKLNVFFQKVLYKLKLVLKCEERNTKSCIIKTKQKQSGQKSIHRYFFKIFRKWRTFETVGQRR